MVEIPFAKYKNNVVITIFVVIFILCIDFIALYASYINFFENTNIYLLSSQIFIESVVVGLCCSWLKVCNKILILLDQLDQPPELLKNLV